MKYISISGHKIGKGETAQINLNIAKLPSRTHIDIPVFVNRAAEDGPVLLLLAGIHGDEINGTEIVRRLIKKGLTKPTRGSIIAIPMLNIYGFLNFNRQFPDGKDINRSFPGSTKGSLASRVAYIITREILPQIDYGVDFHTGGSSRANYPQVRCKVDDEKNMELAKAFAAPFILNSAFRDKSLRKEASKKGKRIIVYEGGESMRFDEDAIERGANGALRLIHHLGMGDKNPKARRKTRVLMKSGWVRARASGLLHLACNNGEYVKKNEVLGTITDPFGDFHIKVKASNAGYLIGINNMPIVNQGDALFHIGHEIQ